MSLPASLWLHWLHFHSFFLCMFFLLFMSCAFDTCHSENSLVSVMFFFFAICVFILLSQPFQSHFNPQLFVFLFYF